MCGVVAPSEAQRCESCQRPLAEVRVPAPDTAPEIVWVAVRARFRCGACRFLAPLDQLDLDGGVECVQCGLRQRYDAEYWTEALTFAHAVGDLAGSSEGRTPHPFVWIGSDNPYRDVGVARTFATESWSADLERSIDAAGGYPVCHGCHVPLETRSGPAPGTLVAECGSCHERATYSLPSEASPRVPALIGVVADAHRLDRPAAREVEEAGAVALACPACGAPLVLKERVRLQKCEFCRATCLAPKRVLAGAARGAPPPQVWWLLFRGPSKARAALESPPPSGQEREGRSAVDWLRPGGSATLRDAVPTEPGVYAAPERRGLFAAQILLSVVMGSAALALGYWVAGP